MKAFTPMQKLLLVAVLATTLALAAMVATIEPAAPVARDMPATTLGSGF